MDCHRGNSLETVEVVTIPIAAKKQKSSAVKWSTKLDALREIRHKWCHCFSGVEEAISRMTKGGDLVSTNRRKRKQSHIRDGQRRLIVRGIRREPVDLGKFSRALLGLAAAEAERQAQADHAERAHSAGDEVASSRPSHRGGADA
jgi:hypothetical protein